MISEPRKEMVSFSSLNQQVQSWLQVKQNTKLQCAFKYPSLFLKSLKNQFMVRSILYSCLKQMKNFISGEESEKNMKVGCLAFELKEEYYQMSVEGIWNDTFNFQFSLVYLVKIICAFCKHFFKEVEVDAKFEGQIFIILVHVFLGANVSQKSYKILERKFTGKSTTFENRKKKRLFAKESIAKELTVEAFEKIETRMKTSADQFKEDLMASLYVEPLPKLQIKRQSLQSFTLPRNSLEEFALNRKLQGIEQHLKKRNMKSTQLSTSMETSLKKYNSFVAMNIKPFKINHRLPLNASNGGWRRKQNMADKRQTPFLNKRKDEKENYKREYRQWLKIISEMKEQIVDQKAKMELDSFHLIQDRKTSSRKKQEEKPRESVMIEKKEDDTKQEGEKATKATAKKQQLFDKIIPKTFDVEDIEEEIEGKKFFPNSKQLKIMKKNFEEKCEERIGKIEHSIFTLPGLKNINKLYDS